MRYDDRKSPQEQLILREFRLKVEKLRWAVRMRFDAYMKIEDYGHEMAAALTAWFVSWPEKGTVTVSWPATWWDHLKRTLNGRYPRLFRKLKWEETSRTFEAMAVLPTIDLPPDHKSEMFAVFHEVHKW